MGIRVRATALGHLGHLREPGDEFTLDRDDQFAPEWMEKLDKPAKPAKAEKADSEKK